MATSEQVPVVEVDLLGPIRVRTDGDPVDNLARRPRVLLAVLALSADRPVPTERLLAAAWGEDAQPSDGRATVHNYVYRLRQALGKETIRSEANGYSLRMAPECVDIVRFQRLVDEAGSTPAPERAYALLVDAIGLWRGAPFEDLDSRLLEETEAPALRERYLDACERSVDLDLAAGRFTDAAARAQELVADHPLRESSWLRLIRAVAGSGRVAQALEHYESARTRIADELGVSPGEELRRIHADLLAERPVNASAACDDVATAMPAPRQLPPDVAGFAGRRGELTALDRIIENHDPGTNSVMIAVVHGPGGIGKTSLVVHWAHRMVDRFRDGQLFVNLRGYDADSPVTVLTALENLLRAVGVPSDRIPDTQDERTSLLRSVLADRQLLIVLDNAREAEHVRPLLPGTGGSVVVVTSRSQLRDLVARERAYRVSLDQLDAPDSLALLSASLDTADVSYDAETLEELAEYCGHLPLALALAAEHASRHPEIGPREIVAELRGTPERLEVLDSADTPSSLRQVFARSYEALDAEASKLFRFLGLYPGPDIGAPAAAALAGTSFANARRVLDRLVNANLLLQRRLGRYEPHDLIRAYATELTEAHDTASERDAALGRYLEWFIHSSLNAGRHLRAPAVEVDTGIREPAVQPVTFDSVEQAMAWYDAERDALLSAIRRAADTGRDQAVYQLVYVSRYYFVRQRAFGELLDLLAYALQAARRVGQPVIEAHIVTLVGMAHGDRLELAEASDWMQRAVEMFEAAGRRSDQAWALSILGMSRYYAGMHAESLRAFEQAAAIDREDGNTGPAVVTRLLDRAPIYRDIGRPDTAIDVCEEALSICRERSVDPLYEAGIWRLLGSLRAEEGRSAEAIDCYERALDLARRRSDQWFEGLAMIPLGRLLRDEGRIDEARGVLRRAKELFDELDPPDSWDFNRGELEELARSVAER